MQDSPLRNAFPTPDSSVTSDFSPDAAPLPPLGFIGLGHMGRIIARKLLDANNPLIIFDNSLRQHEEFVHNHDVTISNCPADVILRCNITFCCEPDKSIVKKMVFDPKGVLDGLDEFKKVKVPFEMDKGVVLLETIDPKLSININTAICAQNGLYVEAPLIGTLEMAENNSVKIIAAGNDILFGKCVQYFTIFAKNSLFLGDHIGRALDLKVVHTMIEGPMNAALKEIITVSNKKEVSPEHFLKKLDSSPLSCPALREKARAIFQNKKETTADIQSLRKDMAIVSSAAYHSNLPIPIASIFSQTLVSSQREIAKTDELKAAKVEAEKLQGPNN